MAELFPQQNKISFPQSLAAAQKFPVIANRIFGTLAEAQEYVDKAKGSAIPGIYLSVIADGDNNGAYWVAQAAGYDGAEKGVLQKMGEGGGSSGGGGSVDVTYDSVINALGYTPFDAADFTWIKIKSTLGISDWALNAQKPTYTKSEVGLGNVDNLAASGYFTLLDSNTSNVVDITIGGTNKKISQKSMRTSLGLGALAYKESLAFSDLTTHPTTLAGYGITDALGSTGTAISAERLADESAFTIWGNNFFEGGKPKNVSGNLVLGAEEVIKIGDATISWDSLAGMLKIDKGIYSSGAITAGAK